MRYLHRVKPDYRVDQICVLKQGNDLGAGLKNHGFKVGPVVYLAEGRQVRPVSPEASGCPGTSIARNLVSAAGLLIVYL